MFARLLRNANKLEGEGVPISARSPAARADTIDGWLGRLQTKLKAVINDQRGEKYLEEVLFQNQEGYEPESCPLRQPLLHTKMDSYRICTFLKINMLASNTPDLSHLSS